MAGYAAVPPKGSPERALLAARVYELAVSGTGYREIAKELNLGSTSTIARLYNEHIEPSEMTTEIRDAELAKLDTWHERLEEAAEIVLAGERPEEMAKLATAAARISAERRRLHAVDIPVTLNINHGEIKRNPAESTKLARLAEEWQRGQDARDQLETEQRRAST